MKAEIRKGGLLYIIAENPTEALALKQITGTEVCDECRQIKMNHPITFNTGALEAGEAIRPKINYSNWPPVAKG